MCLPIGVLWTETELVQHRLKEAQKVNSILIHAAIVDVIGSGGHFKKVLESIDG
jgi:hypothetical protein